MKVNDFKNKKVTVIGLGLHGGGLGTAKFFVEAGAKVLVTDLRSRQELKDSLVKLADLPIKYVLNQHRPEDFINTDLVIKNPAVPDNSKYLALARSHKIPIETDVGIFFELCPAPIIGVTGSKGKSTVTSLIGKLLAKKYSQVIVAGNIRSSVLRKLKKIDKKTLVVLELSSWQLAGLRAHRKSPHCAVVTNILPDHLNRYQSINEYINDKKEIFRWQKKKDYLILNEADPVVKEFASEAKAEVLSYGEKSQAEEFQQIKDKIKLKGRHNLSNALAAVAVAKLYKLSDKTILKVLSKFNELEGRLETVKTVEEVEYINDTTATIPEATLAALDSLPPDKKIILIAGGNDKKLKFEDLSQAIKRRVKSLILLSGTATEKLQAALSDSRLEIVGPLDNMAEAVQQAKERAEAGDIVLLSPAATSFGMFKHEFERGQAFAQAVEEL